ncbi:MAG: hypothetical protein AB1512_32535 [Thermodesulfobacteriota bacterium]
MADFIVGSPARYDDFWFRSEFIEDLWEALGKHNILLLAPRRTGKTSVTYRMLDNPKEGWLVIHLNVEDLKTPCDFIVSLIDAIHEHQPRYLQEVLAKSWGFLSRILGRIEKIEAHELKLELRKSEELKTKWQERAEELMETVFKTGEKILFIIDELPDMLNSMLGVSQDEYGVFLHWFRRIRERSLKKNLRWLVGGSVNLIAALDQQGMVKLVNDLKVEPLPSFSDEDVRIFVEEMLQQYGVPFDPTVVPRIVELLGSPIPLFLQMLTQELYRFWRRNKTARLSAAMVDEVFNKALLGEMARDKLQHYRTRIDVHYSREEREAAYHLLDSLSLSDEGRSQEVLFHLYRQVEEQKTGPRTGAALAQAFQRLLLYLQSDFYIERKPDGAYDFASRLLKTWWKKYYGYECGGGK